MYLSVLQDFAKHAGYPIIKIREVPEIEMYEHHDLPIPKIDNFYLFDTIKLLTLHPSYDYRLDNVYDILSRILTSASFHYGSTMNVPIVISVWTTWRHSFTTTSEWWDMFVPETLDDFGERMFCSCTVFCGDI